MTDITHILHIIYSEYGDSLWEAKVIPYTGFGERYSQINIKAIKSLSVAKVLIELIAQEELGIIKIKKETINYV